MIEAILSDSRSYLQKKKRGRRRRTRVVIIVGPEPLQHVQLSISTSPCTELTTALSGVRYAALLCYSPKDRRYRHKSRLMMISHNFSGRPPTVVSIILYIAVQRSAVVDALGMDLAYGVPTRKW